MVVHKLTESCRDHRFEQFRNYGGRKKEGKRERERERGEGRERERAREREKESEKRGRGIERDNER